MTHNNNHRKKKYYPEQCEDDMTFEECELAILRQAIDENERAQGEKLVKNDQIMTMIKILEEFLISRKLICYGGTAANNILPEYAQFYNRDVEIPDYDFFSPLAMNHTKELADIYYKNGYTDVEAKSGIHHGTYKVYVNFIPIADITYIHPELFRGISKESIVVGGIHYVPPNYLRMSMYLELSRPAGDIGRWEKVFKRLTLLNTHYPMKMEHNCNTVDFQRKMESSSEDSEKIYTIIRDTFIELGVVFFGGYASSLYSKYMPKDQRKLIRKIPDFDVLYEEPEKCAATVQERLAEGGFEKVKLYKHEAIGEIIPDHIELRIGNECLAFIYSPIACHNYNVIRIGDHKEVKVATIDTILSLYLAFMYAEAPYYYKDRILCMAKFLFEVEQKNRLKQTGLLKRFNPTCYGTQETMNTMRAMKAEKYKELKSNRDSTEYKEWFFKYVPGDLSLTKSLPRSLTKSLPRSLTKPLPRSLTKSLPRSLTKSLPESSESSESKSKTRSKAKSLDSGVIAEESAKNKTRKSKTETPKGWLPKNLFGSFF